MDAAPTRSLDPATVWMMLARRALAAGDPQAALVAFDGAIVNEPRLALAHLGRAGCLAELGREAEAADELAITARSAVGQPEALFTLARICAWDGQVAFAAPLLAEALRLRPDLAASARAERIFADHPAYAPILR